ncbi:uncharacterized protein LOC133806259 [Humulus lupulus]|uniref:uncharacterized protein LOC133806259 n=1 Tax=Humulus lupulus TaxID=3486 RepID=UPI002B4036FC|nr:uncharacterized protein LOC133806259 [Humulus lupulus]
MIGFRKLKVDHKSTIKAIYTGSEFLESVFAGVEVGIVFLATKEYTDAAWDFVKMVERNYGFPNKIICPCKKCRKLNHHCVDDVFEHLVITGMDPTYRIWVHHGEQPIDTQVDEVSNDMDAFDLYTTAAMDDVDNNIGCGGGEDDEFVNEDLQKKLEDAETPLYEGSEKYTKLSSIVALYRLKNLNGWTDKIFTMLLELLCDMFPKNNVLPDSMYSVRKFLRNFDLKYEKIDACINDCCLFRKEKAKMDVCPKCSVCRWKVDKPTKNVKVGEAAKVLRYFPIIPRLKRLFRSKEMAENLRWHFTHKSFDGKMRHPVDTPAWDSINERWPEFNLEPRNLRLGLAADGINPYKSLSSTYSCWPVMLVIYNLPPWLCMRDENTFLSLLIPGRKQPGNDIDIYLEPLIEDLNKLWNNGVHTYDAFDKSFFNLKAMLLWTINDFPAYGNLAGCTTKGKTACPICGNDTCATRLKHSKKISYQNTRRFLLFDHPYRSKKAWFNGATEERGPPKVLSGSEIVEELNQITKDFGKNMNPKKRSRDNKVEGMWKKKSIFFNLPYWEVLLVRHNLDVMHIEKNDLGIKKALHPVEKDGTIRLPTATYTLSRSEKKMFCQRLFDLKLPDGYSSNISNCVVVEERKLMGLKSHDFHVLMQQLLVVAIRGLMEDGPREAIIRLSKFFNGICQHVVDVKEIIELEAEVVETICMFERYFPPSFFDPMVHLVVHLGREVLLCGPVQFRWMYHFERYMKLLKGYVMQPTHPEASIAERYIADESMRFCASFFKQSNDEGSFIGRNEYNDSDVILEGRPLHRGVTVTLNDKDLASAHRYVLFNLAVTEQYLE